MWREFDKTNIGAVQEMDVFVRSHGNSHFSQMPYWADVKTFWDWRGVTIYRGSTIIAAMGLLIRQLPLGFTVFYAPRGPVCDRNNKDIWCELMSALKFLAKKYHAILLYADPDELDSNEEFRTIMHELGFRETADDGFGNIQPQYVFRLDISSKDEDALFKAFSAKTRYNIGLAQRKGVTVKEYSGSDNIPEHIFDSFYSLMQTTGQRDRFYIRSLPYFKGLLNALQNDSRLFIAYLNGQPIAGSIEIFCGNKAWYLYGASSNEHRNVMPNYLLQWTMIKRAIAQGCKIYDFRGVPGNTSEADPLYGLYRFKKGFSGVYTKFTGLFCYLFRPVYSRIFELALRVRRTLNAETRK